MNSHDTRYKWVALSNTTLGMLIATINSSIVLISLPAIFNGVGLNPLQGPQVLGALPAANAAALTDRQFFPDLISGPFHDGLVIVFWLAIIMGVAGAAASLIGPRRRTADGDPVAGEEQLIEELYPAQSLTPVPAATDRR